MVNKSDFIKEATTLRFSQDCIALYSDDFKDFEDLITIYGVNQMGPYELSYSGGYFIDGASEYLPHIKGYQIVMSKKSFAQYAQDTYQNSLLAENSGKKSYDLLNRLCDRLYQAGLKAEDVQLDGQKLFYALKGNWEKAVAAGEIKKPYERPENFFSEPT